MIGPKFPTKPAFFEKLEWSRPRYGALAEIEGERTPGFTCFQPHADEPLIYATCEQFPNSNILRQSKMNFKFKSKAEAISRPDQKNR